MTQEALDGRVKNNGGRKVSCVKILKMDKIKYKIPNKRYQESGK